MGSSSFAPPPTTSPARTRVLAAYVTGLGGGGYFALGPQRCHARYRQGPQTVADISGDGYLGRPYWPPDHPDCPYPQLPQDIAGLVHWLLRLQISGLSSDNRFDGCYLWARGCRSRLAEVGQDMVNACRGDRCRYPANVADKPSQPMGILSKDGRVGI
jgi:hypothetical protein